MTIKYYSGGPLPVGKWIVSHRGKVHQVKMTAQSFTVYQQLICDTANEAESMRLLLEQRREELEAVERKYEQLIVAEVSHG